MYNIPKYTSLSNGKWMRRQYRSTVRMLWQYLDRDRDNVISQAAEHPDLLWKFERWSDDWHMIGYIICIHLHPSAFICYIHMLYHEIRYLFLNLMISLFLFESAHVFHFFRSAGGLTAGSRGYGETSQFICAVAQWDQWSTAEKSPHKDHKAGSAMSWLVSPVWLKTSFKEFAAFPMTLAPATSVAWLKTESEDGDWMRLACFLCFCNFCL